MNPKLMPFFRRAIPAVILVASLAASAAGPVVLLGVWLDSPYPDGVASGRPQLAPAAAIALTLAGVALGIQRREAPSRTRRLVAGACAAGATLVGLLILVDHFAYGTLRTDRFLAGAGGTPNDAVLPSFHTGLTLLLLGSALLTLDVRPRRGPPPGQCLALLAGHAVFLVLTGYAFGVPAAYRITSPPDAGMALGTALLGGLLCAGVLCARPDTGFPAVFLSSGGGGVLVRRLLLAPILVPVAVGGLRLALRGAGVDSELIGWVFGLAYFVVFTSLFWWVAATVFRAEGGRARAEAGLHEANAQLAAANQELEAFSYSVSHDLRAPLRSIDGFSRILLEDFAGSLPDEAKEYLQDVRASARHMGQLVDDLLAFARLSRQPIRAQQVRTGEVVRQCLEELRAEREGRQVELVVADLPPCTGDAALLKQVWVNLLANALKYSRKAAAARVEVGFSTAGEAGEVTYFVRDNGVGFDMRYAHKLFGVFQRLHRAEEFEGTGVGLAIVQRVVHRHGGRVWADARPGEGATFFFTLRGVGGGQ